jgi:hypothetical protein
MTPFRVRNENRKLEEACLTAGLEIPKKSRDPGTLAL